MQTLVDRLLEFWPSGHEAFVGAVWGTGLILLAAIPATLLHERGWRIGDTRKIFHFTIFTGAALLRWQAGTGAVVVCGLMVVTMVLHATWRGSRSSLFRALARPSDAPHEKLHVISPLMSTAIGGVIAQIVAGPQAIVAYLVGGWGDAVGEPVGIRWGRHRYRVPSWGIPFSDRSCEGSAAVVVASGLAAALGLYLTGATGWGLVFPAICLGLAAGLLEAASPHGWDNLILVAGIAVLTPWLTG